MNHRLPMNMKKYLVIVLAISLLAFLPFRIPTVNAASSPDHWAVVVGVEGGDADHLDNDAQDFANVLMTQYGYPSSNIILLTNSQATKGAVIGALQWVRDHESSASTVSIFFSAHGNYDTLILYDDVLWDYELSNILVTFESENILVVINACHSGSFLDVADIIAYGILITACEADEITYDIDSYQNTIFIEYFVDQGMSQGNADANQDGTVTMEEAFYYAESKCNPPPGPLIVPRTHPQMVDNYAGDFVHAPWFMSLPLALLATIGAMLVARKKGSIRV